jgi:peptidoglycan/LPS O-acetylase OafA/YrhL
MTGPTRPIDSLTTLRGLLALWVAAYHFWNDLVRLFPPLDSLSPLALSGHFAVPGFFILSGFVLAFNYSARFASWPPRRVFNFWILRLARIYPVHFVTLLAVAVMVGVSDRLAYKLTDAGYSKRDFILNLLLMQTWVPDFHLNWNYPSWSISSEWFAYLIFPFAAAGLLSRIKTPARAGVFALTCLAGAGVVFSLPQFPFRELVIVIPTFFAGTALYALTRYRPAATSHAARSLPELLLGALAVACYIPRIPGTLLIVFTLFSLVFALARLMDRPHRWWLSRPLIYLGEVSYSLYMTHTLAQKVLNRLLPAARFESSDPLTKMGVVAVYVAIIVASCLASYYLVERPVRRWGRRRLRDQA